MEIKPQELRIGNLVDRNGIMEVLGIGANKKLVIYDHYNKERLPYGLDVESFKGIDLTPEWLEKCHAIKRTDITSEIIFGTYRSLEIVKDTDGYRLHLTSTTGGNISLRKIKYLHDLQNSYYGVFGQELAIDNKSL